MELSAGSKDLWMTVQQKSVEPMLRPGVIRSVKIRQAKVIHTSLTELTVLYFWSGELIPGLNFRSEVVGLYERGDLGDFAVETLTTNPTTLVNA